MQGIKTIYANEVAYVPLDGAPRALDAKYMAQFCSPADADFVFGIAIQVLKTATLVGRTSNFTMSYNAALGTMQPGPDQVYVQADSSGGRFMYGTADGYRPIRIQSLQDGLDQWVSELVCSYQGQSGLKLVQTGQGAKLQWA